MSVRRLLVALTGAALVACGGGTAGGGSSNVPSGFTHCPQSGDVTKISDKDTQGEWQYQQKAGATAGDIEVYAGSSGECAAMPDIRKGSSKLLASAVLTYKDSSSASSAAKGLFGVGMSQIASAPGAQSGSATGFGASSAYAYSAAEAMAVWTNGSKVAAVIGENVSESEFKAFANGVKGQTG